MNRGREKKRLGNRPAPGRLHRCDCRRRNRPESKLRNVQACEPSRRKESFALIVVLASLAGSGCDFPGQPRRADRPIPANQVVDFTTLYGQNCAGCHGAGGRLGPAPPLNDKKFLAIVPDSVLLGVISEGRPGTPMPAFARDHGGTLTEAQVKVIAEGLKPRWGKPEEGRGSLPPYSDSVEGVEASGSDRERGAVVFRRACAGCHGAEGRGGKAGALNNPAFLALISDQALRRYAITGRPDLGMPDHAGKAGRAKDFQPLTSAEIGDLVALLARWRQEGSEAGSAGGQ